MNYDELLETMVTSIDELANDIDTIVRGDFQEYSDWIDVYVGGLRSLDRTDFFNLSGTMRYLQIQLHNAHTKCTCDNIRWHSCLGQIDVLFQKHAERSNQVILKLVCEERNMDYDELMTHIKQGPTPIPDTNIDFTVPNDLKDLM